MNQIAALSLTASFTLFFTPPAYADVNMLEGSFRTTFIDAKINNLKIERKYDSRSTYSGLFGFGWCSTFDTKLDLHTLLIKDCGKSNADSTARYANGVYSQTLKSGLTRIYSADDGALIALKAQRNPAVVIDRGNGDPRRRLPRAAALGEGLKMRPDLIRLEFDSLHENVSAIELPDRQRLTFEYNDKRDLLQARNSWNNTYRFDYDSLHNLTHVAYPDTTSEDITYDTDHDQLTQFQGRDRCIETYEHTISSSSKERRQTSTAKLTCNGKAKRQAVFRFGFLRQNNSWKLNSFERGTK